MHSAPSEGLTQRSGIANSAAAVDVFVYGVRARAGAAAAGHVVVIAAAGAREAVRAGDAVPWRGYLAQTRIGAEGHVPLEGDRKTAVGRTGIGDSVDGDVNAHRRFRCREPRALDAVRNVGEAEVVRPRRRRATVGRAVPLARRTWLGPSTLGSVPMTFTDVAAWSPATMGRSSPSG